MLSLFDPTAFQGVDLDAEPEIPDLLSEPRLDPDVEEKLRAFELEGERNRALLSAPRAEITQRDKDYQFVAWLCAGARFHEPPLARPQTMTRGDKTIRLHTQDGVRIVRPRLEILEERAARRKRLRHPDDFMIEDHPDFALLAHHIENGADVPGELLSLKFLSGDTLAPLRLRRSA